MLFPVRAAFAWPRRAQAARGGLTIHERRSMFPVDQRSTRSPQRACLEADRECVKTRAGEPNRRGPNLVWLAGRSAGAELHMQEGEGTAARSREALRYSRIGVVTWPLAGVFMARETWQVHGRCCNNGLVTAPEPLRTRSSDCQIELGEFAQRSHGAKRWSRMSGTGAPGSIVRRPGVSQAHLWNRPLGA